jgi:hypothetical protein
MRVLFTVPPGAIVTSIFTVPVKFGFVAIRHDRLHEAFNGPFVLDGSAGHKPWTAQTESARGSRPFLYRHGLVS